MRAMVWKWPLKEDKHLLTVQLEKKKHRLLQDYYGFCENQSRGKREEYDEIDLFQEDI